MRLYRLNNIEPGMVLGRSIYEENNRLMLAAGNKITPNILERFIERGYNYIYIMQDGTEDVIPEDVISYSVLLQSSSKLESIVKNLKKIIEFRDISIEKAMELIEEEYIESSNVSFDVREIVEEILNDISFSAHKILYTLIPKSRSTYFVDHAINTTILSTLIGYKYRFKKPELRSLAIGSFLHDIGKIIVEQLIGHDDYQTAQKLYKEHSTFSYLMLQKCGIISSMENQIVYQHHENQDGSGFPKGYKGLNVPPIKSTTWQKKGMIFRLAEICTVADAYDRMVLNPFDENQLTPSDVIRKLVSMAGTVINKDIVRTLVQIVPIYPVGVYIRVAKSDDSSITGYYGVVADINAENLNKPVIVLFIDNKFNRIKPFKIDTSQLKNVKLELAL